MQEENPLFTTHSFTVYGEPASKENSRRLVLIGGKPRLIKSKKALDYADVFRAQCPRLDPLLEGPVQVQALIFYATRRPDLDESLILDLMQGFIYKNDRQVRRKIITWGLDRDKPRAEIKVRQMPSLDLDFPR